VTQFSLVNHSLGSSRVPFAHSAIEALCLSNSLSFSLIESVASALACLDINTKWSRGLFLMGKAVLKCEAIFGSVTSLKLEAGLL